MNETWRPLGELFEIGAGKTMPAARNGPDKTPFLINELVTLSKEQFEHDEKLFALLKPLTDGTLNVATD